MLESIRRYFAVRRYAKRFGPLLAERYGEKTEYSVAEVRLTAEKNDFDREYLKYAMALFLSAAEFRRAGLGDARQRKVLREYVIDRWSDACPAEDQVSG